VIIDFHTHIDEAPAFGWIDPPDKIVALLDEAGIDLAVAMTYTDLPGLNPDALDYILAAVDRFPDRLVAFVRLNPNYRAEAAAFLDEAIERGARGLKLHPTTTLAHPAEEATVSLLRRCGELGVPALFHCGDDPYTTPQTFGLSATAAPDCAIVLGHMGGYLHVEEAIAVAEAHANVYLETSAMPYPPLIRTAVERVGSRRVLFGSDGPGCNPALELAKVRQAGLSTDDEALVLGGNAARLLKVRV
jgi:predicted TIM-barrel fold metal-dependent hydrolase